MKLSLTSPASAESGDRSVTRSVFVAFVPFALALALLLALVMSLVSAFWPAPADSRRDLAPTVENSPESQVASTDYATGS